MINLLIDSQPRLLARELIELMVKLQVRPEFDPARQRIHVPLQIMTSENSRS